MKKFFGLTITIFCIILLSGCGKTSKESVLKKVDKSISNSKGYQIQSEMELINADNSYKYDVLVSYKKSDNYRVSLKNKSNNHEQIILKNEDGVYVLTPTLNKSFKFQSKWPYNNSQAYLPNAIVKDIKNDSNYSMKQTKDGYVFTSTVNYKNNVSLTHQEVVVDKNNIIKKVTVYDDNDTPQIIVKFKQTDMKAKFDNNYFKLEKNMETITSDDKEETSNTNILEDAIYPMYLPEGTYLETEKTVELDKGSRVILTFAGENPFMLVEETASTAEDITIIPTSGDLDIFADAIAIIGDTSVTWTSNGVEYYLVSSNLSQSDLVSVAKSIATIPVSK